MAQTIIDNINSILNTKSELQSILVENGQEGGEVFSSYPAQFRSAIASGGSDLSNYPTFEDIAAMSYVTDTQLQSAGYITSYDLSGYVTYSYATQNYFNGLQDYGEGNVVVGISRINVGDDNICTLQIQKGNVPSYSYIESYYASIDAISQIPTIDESLIPKENNTYTLGNASYYYAYTYTYNLVLENNTGLSKSTSSRLDFNLNGDNKFYIGTGGFFPVGSKQLGSNGSKFSATYTENLYGTYIQTSIYNKDLIPSENNTYSLGSNSYFYNSSYTSSIYLHERNGWVNVSNWQTKFRLDNGDKYYLTSNRFYPYTAGAAHLGSSSNYWGDTYTANLYVNGTNIEARIAAIEAYLGINQT